MIGYCLNRGRLGVLCGLIVLLISLNATAFAQFNLLAKKDGAVSGDKLGWTVAGAGDVNGDGAADYIIGMPYYDPSGLSSGGRAIVYSGANGAILHQKDGTAAAEGLGYWVAGAGDVNGDGRADFIVSNQLQAYVYSGTNGALLHQKIGGGPVAGLGDVNGDGKGDFIVSDFGQSTVYSGANGAILYQKAGGTAVAGIGDVNGDGRADFLVTDQYADPGITNAGSAYIYSGANGALLYQKNGEAASDLFGSSAAGAGDVNGDGRPDFIVGARVADAGGAINSGAAYVFSGATGALIYKKSGNASEQWGQAVGGAGDTDGDGRADFLVSSIWSSPGGLTSAGSVFLFSGRTGGLLQTFDGNFEYENFGYVAAGVGDVNRDGRSDFIIGGPNASPGGRLYAGSAYIYGGGSGGPDPCTNDGEAPILTCSPDKQINCGGAVNFNQPTASDNCDPSPSITIVSTTQTNGPGVDQVTHTRTWIATDQSGNQSVTCSQDIVETCTTDPCANDNEAPILSCSADKQISCGGAVNFNQPTASDNCDPSPSITIVSTTQTNGPGADQVTHTRTWIATDQSGNVSAPCSQDIVETCVQSGPDRSQLTESGSSCSDFAGYAAIDLSEICYSTRKGKISSCSPSSFYYYAAITAPAANFTVDIVQSRYNANIPFFDVASRGGITVYDNCSEIGSGTSNSPGQARVTFSGATAGKQYVIAVLYKTGSLSGTYVGTSGLSLAQHYDFAAVVNGQEVTRDADGLSPVACVRTKGGKGPSGSSELVIGSYPNPFNASAQIQYYLAYDGSVRVEIYNVLGRQIRTLVDDYRAAGEYSVLWNGTDENGRTVPSGIYFLRLSTADDSVVEKVNLLK